MQRISLSLNYLKHAAYCLVLLWTSKLLWLRKSHASGQFLWVPVAPHLILSHEVS